MKFNEHLELSGQHALIGASSYHWLNYSPEKMRTTFINEKRKEEGTRLHFIASENIKLGIKLAHLKKAFNQFVNDAIGFKMHSEVVLFHSFNAFGTADAISFRDGILRIHDLKTGVTKPSFNQLDIYAALFCMEYDIDPQKIDIYERLYQGTGFTENQPGADTIIGIMDQMELMDQTIKETSEEYFNQDF